MIVKYNSLDRLEKPQFVLCNPGSTYSGGYLTKVVGTLTDHEAEELVLNFNSQSQLNMRVNRIHHEDADDDAQVYALYRSIQNRRLIFIDNVGYFMITNIENGYEGNKQYKDITAMSIDSEIQQKMIPFIADGTYRFLGTEIPDGSGNPLPPGEEERGGGWQDGIMDIIVRSLPLWQIGHVDDSVAERWRTFEAVDTELNCLSFLLTNVQDAYECIILFDNISRIINVYDQATYVRQTKIHLTREDLINSINITENADDIYTAIRVIGDENTTISAVNPLGTNVIYNFDHYISWMSDDLGEKVLAWQQAVEDARDDYYDLNLSYFEKMSERINIEFELSRIGIQLTMYQRCRDNIVAESNTDLVDEYNEVIEENGGEPIEIYEEIEQTIAHIDQLISDCNDRIAELTNDLEGIEDELSEIKSNVDRIRESLVLSNYFTSTEYEELNHYIFEGTYTDEYVVITDIMTYSERFAQMKILFDRAMLQLEKVSKPTQQFSVDSENFIFAKEFKEWSDELETGCLINVEIEPDDIALLFLTTITLNYDEHSLNLTFGNRYNRFDPKSLYEDVLGKISRSANTLNYIKDVITPITDGEFNYMKNAIETSRNLTMGAALASDGEEVIIDGSGYTGRRMLDNGSYDPRQVKLTGRSLVFTDDAWQSSKVAVGELLFGGDSSAYGINGEAIIGEIIMGNNLHIVDSQGNDLLTVVDGRISSQVQGLDGRLTALEQTTEGVIIRVQSLESTDVDHVTTTTGYTFDANGLHISKSGEEMANLLDNTGMYVTRSGDAILTANNEGVEALNLTANKYLIVGGNSRFEDYSNGTDSNRTACFYLG